MERGRILFVDEHDLYSKAAEHMASTHVSSAAIVKSCGIVPGGGSEEFIAAANELRILDGACGRDSITANTNELFDVLITIGSEAHSACPVFPGMPAVIHWDIDTTRSNRAGIRANFGELEQLIRDFFTRSYFPAFLEARRNYISILDSLHEGILVHDLKRRVIYFSAGAEALTGVRREKVIGRDCHDLFSPNLCSGNCIFCETESLKQVNPATFTSVFLTENSERKEFEINRLPMRDANGQVVGAIATIHDTTRLRQLEDRLGETESFSGMIGQEHKMLTIFELIRDIAQSDFSVVITGESGTGKELVAAAIHSESHRRDKLFVPVNCGALPEGTLESELFGHVRGAFTGAIRDKKGRFELADKGTLFLDEIAEVSPRMQVKLLRVLQEGIIEPVGSEVARKVDVRVICATNRNLKDLVARGAFREDLYYRLAVVPVEVPPLRERRNDIALLARHFLEKTASKLERKGLAFADETVSVLMNYGWPGNVRQLQNAIQFSLIKCRGTILMPDHLPPEILSGSFASFIPKVPGKAGRRPKLAADAVERALLKAGGNKAKAARLLGVGRATLYNYMNGHKELIAAVEV